MAKGEVIIKEENCRGCGYCEVLCPAECLTMSADRYTPLGFILPEVSAPEKCTACGICAMMCPHYAIEVFRYEKTEPSAGD